MQANQIELVLAQRRGQQTLLNIPSIRNQDPTFLADFEDSWTTLWELIVLEAGESTPIQKHTHRYTRAWIWPLQGQTQRAHYLGPQTEDPNGLERQTTPTELCTLQGINQTEPGQPEIELNPSQWHQFVNPTTERTIALVQYTAEAQANPESDPVNPESQGII